MLHFTGVTIFNPIHWDSVKPVSCFERIGIYLPALLMFTKLSRWIDRHIRSNPHGKPLRSLLRPCRGARGAEGSHGLHHGRQQRHWQGTVGPVMHFLGYRGRVTWLPRPSLPQFRWTLKDSLFIYRANRVVEWVARNCNQQPWGLVHYKNHVGPNKAMIELTITKKENCLGTGGFHLPPKHFLSAKSGDVTND